MAVGRFLNLKKTFTAVQNLKKKICLKITIFSSFGKKLSGPGAVLNKDTGTKYFQGLIYC